MDTQVITAGYRLSQWAKVIQARLESGQSIKKFCQTAGINENSYYYWQRKLRKAACAELAKKEESKDIVPSGWMQLTPVKTQQTEATLDIEIKGCHITVDARTDPKLLKEVCRMLRSLC